MIEQSTVLILGAGASCPYGFPTGRGLKERILDILQPLYSQRGNETIRVDERAKPIVEFCDNPAHVIRFYDDFSKSARYSIDVFLQSNPQYDSVGKAAIATALIAHEDEQSLLKDDWYQYLFNHYLVPTGQLDWLERARLKIITFNYDRSFEHFLTTALMRSFRLTEDQAKGHAAKVEVIHVHGILGEYFDETSKFFRPYSPKLSLDAVRRSMKSIRLFHDVQETEEESSFVHKVRQTVVNADRVAFLGFGFGESNVNRIRWVPDESEASLISKGYGRWDFRYIGGTSYQFGGAEVRLAKKLIGIETIDLKPLTCLDYLRESEIFVY